MVARPPRVGSRIQRSCVPSSQSDAVSPCSGAVSLSSAVSRRRSPRATSTAKPWSPIVPETSTRSPACGRPKVARMRPTPAVVTKRPSALPRSTTFVSPATTGTPACSAARAIDWAIRRRSSSGKPSSITKAAESHSGSAPATARSLTVPFTASSPMSPPGKKSGLTTNESVVNASPSRDGGVAELVEQRVGELLDEEPLDELPGRLPARAVGERDDLVATQRGGHRRSRRRRRPRRRPCRCRAAAPACRRCRTPCTRAA